MEEKQNTITDIINELKRLQVEAGKDLECIKIQDQNIESSPAWPIRNEAKNRIEF